MELSIAMGSIRYPLLYLQRFTDKPKQIRHTIQSIVSIFCCTNWYTMCFRLRLDRDVKPLKSWLGGGYLMEHNFQEVWKCGGLAGTWDRMDRL